MAAGTLTPTRSLKLKKAILFKPKCNTCKVILVPNKKITINSFLIKTSLLALESLKLVPEGLTLRFT